MRIVNTAIASANSLKGYNPNMVEEILLVRSLRDSVRKFLANGIMLSNSIISDLDPEDNQLDNNYRVLILSLQLTINNYNIQIHLEFHQKIMQLLKSQFYVVNLCLWKRVVAEKQCTTKYLHKQ